MISEELISPSVLLKSSLLQQTFGFGQYWSTLDNIVCPSSSQVLALAGYSFWGCFYFVVDFLLSCSGFCCCFTQH